MTDFSGLRGFLKFQADAARHQGPDVPREIHACMGCGRAWTEIPDRERSGASGWCWPCRHRQVDPRSSNGDGGKCTDPACPRHGG